MKDYIKIIYNMEIAIQRRAHIGFKQWYDYTEALLSEKRFEEGNHLIERLMKIDNKNPDIMMARLLMYAYRYEDAIDIIKERFEKKPEDVSAYDYLLLGKSYLRLGMISEAKDTFCYGLNIKNTDYTRGAIGEHLRLIKNHLLHDAFIEMNYSAFIRNGYELEPGHVVILKEQPTILAGDGYNDPRFNFKSFLITAIEDDNLYLIPLTSTVRNKGYVLFKEDYPNVGKDRSIKDSYCVTSKDNVISVIDKISNYDLENVRFNLFKSYYFSRKQNAEMKKFITGYAPQPKQYDISLYVDPITKDSESYFIAFVGEDYYIAYQVDFITKTLLNSKPSIISKKHTVFKNSEIDKDDIDYILEQINPKGYTRVRTNENEDQ